MTRSDAMDAVVAAAHAGRGTAEDVRTRAEVDVAMERYADGDDAAFATVYDAMAPRLYGYLLRETRDRARAEDLLQQTMLSIHRSRARFIAGAEVTPWAFAIARRLLVDGFRRARREGGVVPHDPDSTLGAGDAADDVLQARQLAARIRDVLAELPESQRVAFELLKDEGLTVRQAAEVLGITAAAVKLRAHRAYDALRRALGDAVAGSEGGDP